MMKMEVDDNEALNKVSEGRRYNLRAQPDDTIRESILTSRSGATIMRANNDASQSKTTMINGNSKEAIAMTTHCMHTARKR